MLGCDLVEELSGSHDVSGRDIYDFDISSSSDCRRVIEECMPDVIVNAAAYTDVDGCESNKDECFSVNSEGVRNIALPCSDLRIKVVHFSTDYVFDGTKNGSYVEDDICNPINVYGKSKLIGELYLKELSCDYILLRTAWLYGKNGKNFVKTILEKAKTEKELRVVDDQVGSPTYTVDLARLTGTLIEGNYSGVFHAVNDGSCSWYEFALKILEYAKIEDIEIVPIKSGERKAARPCRSVLNCGKFTDTTGIKMRSWQAALKEYMAGL
jgi:dTDP-4-dehydrorhamnose reductase